MKKQSYEMEYVKIEDSGQQFWTEEKPYNYFCDRWYGIFTSGK